MRIGGVPFVVVLLAANASCGSGGRGGGASAAHCEEICARFETCDSSTDELDCRAECEEDMAFSDEAWDTVHQCVVAELSCDQLGGADYDDCVRDGLRGVEPSASTVSARDAIAARANECSEAIDQTEFANDCAEGFGKVAATALVDEVRRCFEEESCDGIEDCVAEVRNDFDVDDTQLVPVPAELGGIRYYRQLCIDFCERTNECLDGSDDCDEQCSDAPMGEQCANRNEFLSAIQECTDGPCGPDGQTFTNCLAEIPDCE